MPLFYLFFLLGQVLAYANWADNGSPALLYPDNPLFEPDRQSLALLYTGQDTNVSSVVRPNSPNAAIMAVMGVWLTGHHLCLKSGGTDLAGYSASCTKPATLLDLGWLTRLEVDVPRRQAIVGAGQTMLNLYHHLASYNLTLVADPQPQTGMAHLLGGGWSFFSRQHGLAADQVLAMKVILASGQALTVTKQQYPDLYWGLLGAGGSQLGVVVEYTLQLQPVTTLTYFNYRFNLTTLPVVHQVWSNWTTDPRLGTSLKLTATNDYLEVVGLFNGTLLDYQAVRSALLVRLVQAGVTTSLIQEVEGSYFYLYQNYLAGCLSPVKVSGKKLLYCEDDSLAQRYFQTISGLPYQALSSADLLTTLQLLQTSQVTASLKLELWGGQIKQVQPNSVAHRSAVYYLEVRLANHQPALDEVSYHRLRQHLEPLLVTDTGQRAAYRNGVQPDLVEACQAYLGDHCLKLRRLKCQYDPKYRLNYPQSFPCL